MANGPQWPNFSGPATGMMGAPQFDFSTPQGAAEAQMWMNQWAADRQGAANRPNIQGPYGSSTWNIDPNTGQYTQTLTPSQNQAFMNAQQEAMNMGLGDLAGRYMQQYDMATQDPYSLGGMPQMQQFNMQGAPQAQWGGFGGLPGIPGQGDLTGERQRQEQQLYDQWSRNMEPRFAQESQQLEQRLADQGIPMGSKRYETELNRLQDRQEESRQDALAQATKFGGQEQERTFGMGLSTRQQLGSEQLRDVDVQRGLRGDYRTEQQLGQQLSQQARQQGISDYERQRYAPWQEFQQTMGQMYRPIMPQQQGMAGINMPGIDVGGMGLGFGGLAQQWQLQQQQMELQRQRMGGGGGGGGGGQAGPAANWLGGLGGYYPG